MELIYLDPRDAMAILCPFCGAPALSYTDGEPNDDYPPCEHVLFAGCSEGLWARDDCPIIPTCDMERRIESLDYGHSFCFAVPSWVGGPTAYVAFCQETKDEMRSQKE